MLKILLAALFVFSAVPASAAHKANLVDPVFAIFDAKSADAVDHGAWTDFLSAYVVAGGDGVARVRYPAVAPEHRAALNAYIASLEAIDPAKLSRAEQLAFWINLYNAATVRIILDRPGVSSIRSIRNPWGTPVAEISGRALTLNNIEHGILRPVFKDARIHYAVNCASVGCPDLARAAYSSANIEAELDAAARRYVNHPRGVSVDKGRVVASNIYSWYAADFGGAETAILDHIRRYADRPLLEALDGARNIAAYRYDWALNAAR